MIKIYDKVAIDAQGRIRLSGLIDADKKAVVYMRLDDKTICVEEYQEEELVPKMAIRKVDQKGRLYMPKWLIGGVEEVLVGTDSSGIIVLVPCKSEELEP